MIEQLRPGVSANNARVVLFDFDGTISIIRAGWMDVMVPMMVEISEVFTTTITRAEVLYGIEVARVSVLPSLSK